MRKNNENVEPENNIPEQNPVSQENTPETAATNEQVAVVGGAEVVNDAAESAEFDEVAARKARQRARRIERRHRRNARIARFRTLKNFFIWLLGVFFLPIALVASMFVIPVDIINSAANLKDEEEHSIEIIGNKVYVGSKEDYDAHKDDVDNPEYYKNLNNFSMFELARYLSGDGLEYTNLENFPALMYAIENLYEGVDEKGNPNGITLGGRTIPYKEIVKINIEGIKKLSISNLSSITDPEYIEIVATIGTFITEDMADDFSSLLFGDGTPYGTYADKKDDIDAVNSEVNKKALYYKVSDLPVVATTENTNTTQSVALYEDAATTTESDKSGKFKRAFDDEGNLVAELKKPNGDPIDGLTLYYPPLSDVKIIDLSHVFTDVFNKIEVDDLMGVFVDDSNGGDSALSDLITKIVGADKTISDLDSFSFDDVKLSAFLDEENTTLWDVLKEATNPHEKDANGNELPYTNDDVTVGRLSNFNVDGVDLSTFLEETEDNKDLWKVLRAATGVEENGKVTLNDLKKIDIDKISLDTFLEKKAEPKAKDYKGGAESEAYKKDYDEYETNKKLWDMLDAATTPKEGDSDSSELTVGDLTKGLNFDNVPLSIVLKEDKTDENNTKFWKILRQATKVADDKDVTIGDLSNGLDVDEVYLKDVINIEENTEGNEETFEKNQKLWAIIENAVLDKNNNKVTKETVTLGDLNSRLNINNLPLTTVLEAKDNAKIYDILREATNPHKKDANDNELPYTNDDITIGTLSNFKVGELSLATVLTPSENKKLYDILRDATGKENDNDITIESLSEFKISNLHLATVLDPKDGNNAKLYDILRDATGEEKNDEITISAISAFNVENIKLGTAITDPDTKNNKVLKPLLEDDEVTLGNLGDKIDNLEVSEIFPQECFTKDYNKSVKDGVKYATANDGKTYTVSSTGSYYISKEAKVWLFMFYTPSGEEADGSATTYTKKNVTFKDMQSQMGTTSVSFTTATVKQLIQSGILTEPNPGDYSKVYNYSFKDIIDIAINALP